MAAQSTVPEYHNVSWGAVNKFLLKGNNLLMDKRCMSCLSFHHKKTHIKGFSNKLLLPASIVQHYIGALALLGQDIVASAYYLFNSLGND